MKYLNQLEYPDLPYPTDVSHPDSPMVRASVREAGCGLCCLAMMADRLTAGTLSLRRLISLSEKHGANLRPGTDMKILGPVVAGLLGLDFSVTNSARTAAGCLKNGGSVIANTGGDREGYTGVFSHGGHYILLVSAKGSSFCVLDPSLKPGKYDGPGREGRVTVDWPFAWCSLELLSRETENRNPGFYMFSRKIPV